MEYSVKETVLNLCANALFQVQRPLPFFSGEEGTLFWKSVRRECQIQSVLTVVSEALTEDFGDTSFSEIRNDWKKYSDLYLAQNLRSFHAHEEIHQLMRENRIPYVIIKGCSSAFYYPNPYARAMGDVDFFVHQEDVSRTMQVLEQAGYQCTDELKNNHHHIAYTHYGIHVELHFGLNGIPEGIPGKIAVQYLNDLIEKAEFSEKLGLMLTSEFHHGLILLIHNAHHMTSTGMGLRHLCDWGVFIRSVGDRFPVLFEKPLKEIGMWEYANVMTAVCTRTLGLPKQRWCPEYSGEFLDLLLEDIYGSGNFGVKRADTSDPFFLQDTNQQIENIGLIRRFMRSLNTVTEAHWPIVKKLKLLYPVGWIFFTVRYAFRVLLGKRKKVRIIKTVRSAYKRNRLYQKLRLFSAENAADDLSDLNQDHY